MSGDVALLICLIGFAAYLAYATFHRY